MADSPFVEDAGPGFDPEAAEAGAQEVRAQADAAAREEGIEAYGVPDVPEEKVRHVLFVGGDGLHAAFGVGDYDWVATQRDLERIAPPLTRIINRYEMAKTVAGFSDEAAVAIGVGLWGWRSVLERIAVLRAQEQGQVTGPPPRAPAPAPSPQPAPAPQQPESHGAWLTSPPPPGGHAPAPPDWSQPPPPPPSSPGPAVPGGGAAAPREQAAPQAIEVVPGYVTRAQLIREARERSPNAVPAQAPPAA